MFRAKATAAADEAMFQPSGKAEAGERIVRKGFWPKLARVAGKVPFAEDLVAAYYCALDRNTPTQVRLLLLGALAYFVLPFDGIPDIVPMMGFTDDAAMLAAAIKVAFASIKLEHREAARKRLSE